MFNFILIFLTIYLFYFTNNKCNFVLTFKNNLNQRLQHNPKLPPIINKQPLQVLAGIYIESLGNFKSADMSFDVDLYLYLSWKDKTLNHSSNEFILINDPNIRRYIWLPDLYFANARSSRFHNVIAPNFNLFIDKNGEIAYSTRITLAVACNLDLSLYPMDSQQCAIQFLSYAYIEKQVKVIWFFENSTRYNPEIQLPEFKILNISNEYCNGIYNYAIMENKNKRDKFSCLEAIIYLNRQIGYHIVQSYIPTGLIVIISWVSFWIDRRAVPARVTLSFTTLLSLSTLGNGLRFGLPQVAYAKAIDFWFGACLFFVFLSLLEFAAVNSYMRQAEKFERYATYYAKKNSSLNTQSFNYFIKNGQIGHKCEEEKEREDILSLLPSIDASISSEIDSTFNVIKCYSSTPTTIKKEINPTKTICLSNNLEKNNKKLTKKFTHFNSLYELSLINEKQTKNNIYSKKVGKIETNPLVTNHFLRQGFLYSRKGLAIDRISRWLFPLTFTIWNSFYWIYYLYYK